MGISFGVPHKSSGSAAHRIRMGCGGSEEAFDCEVVPVEILSADAWIKYAAGEQEAREAVWTEHGKPNGHSYSAADCWLQAINYECNLKGARERPYQ